MDRIPNDRERRTTMKLYTEHNLPAGVTASQFSQLCQQGYCGAFREPDGWKVPADKWQDPQFDPFPTHAFYRHDHLPEGVTLESFTKTCESGLAEGALFVDGKWHILTTHWAARKGTLA
jgi:hypothetical protein